LGNATTIDYSPLNRSRTLFSRLLAISLCSFLTFRSFCEEPAKPVPLGDDTIYVVGPGETLESISKEHFGTDDVTELCNLRGSTEAVKEGDLLLFPGPIRAAAVGQIAKAEKCIAEAVEVKAGKYAKFELASARNWLMRADNDRLIGEYQRAKVRGQEAVEKARDAKRVALDNMRPKAELDRFRFGGELLIGAGDELWAAPEQGTKITEGIRLRTPQRARSSLEFHDGVSIYLDGGSELYLQKVRTSLEVNHPSHCITSLSRGSVQVDARKLDRKNRHEIHCGGNQIEIHAGTVVHITNVGGRLLLHCTAGSVDFLSATTPNANVVRANLPAGKAAVFNPNDGFKPLRLPRQPKIPAEMIAVRSVSQRPDLGWESPLKEWRLELARDADFLNIVEDVNTTNPSWRSFGLVEGNYHWRVRSLDANGFAGLSSQASLSVKPNLDVAIRIDPPLPNFVAGREILLSPDTRLALQPVQEGVNVSGYEIRMSGGEWVPWRGTSPVGQLIDPSKNWALLEARAVGLADQRGKTLRQPIRIDKAGPKLLLNTTVERQDGQDWVAAVLTAEDPSGVKQVEFSKDGKISWQPYVGAVRVPLADSRLLWFRANDNIGNQSRAMNAYVRVE